jgi:hypothetical protein
VQVNEKVGIIHIVPPFPPYKISPILRGSLVHPEARTKIVWDMDTMAMNDAAYLILQWPTFYHVRWNFVKGWTHTPNIRSTNARMDSVWLDLPEFPHAR